MPIASALRPALRWLSFVTFALVSPFAWAQSTSVTAADGFDPNVNGNVYAVAIQADGKILVAGKFSSVQPNGSPAAARNNIARFLPNGRTDTAFNPSVNEQINAMALQPDGKIIIGGKFTQAGGATRNRAARLNTDGSLDATFDPNLGAPGDLTPEVMAVAVEADGKVLFGGGFTQAKGTARNRIARFNSDGSLDTGFNPNANGLVLAIAVQADGRILIGGGFTSLTPSGTTAVVRNRVARLAADGTLDTSFDPNANNAVATIEPMPNGRILIGGSFTSLTPNGGGASPVMRIARLDASGAVSADFVGSADGPVSVIKLQRDGGILVGGAFSTLGGGGRPYFGRLLPHGAVDAIYHPGPNFSVYAIAVQPDGAAVLGGGFTTLRGSGSASIVRNHVARVTAVGGLDADFRPDANGRLQALGVQADGKIFVGGSFTSIAGETRRGFARLNANGSLDTAFNADVDGPVLAFAEQADRKILIGGDFSRVGGALRFNVARLNEDGSVDASFDPGANNQVNAIAVQSDGKVLIGGAFNQLRPHATTEPVARSALARVNADGSLDLSFDPNPNGAVNAIVVQTDGKILIGGSFTGMNLNPTTGVRRMGLARINSDGTTDPVFDPTIDGTVTAIAVQADKKVVFGGTFVRIAPNNGDTAARNNLGRVNENGSLDATFDPNPNASIEAIVIQADKKIIVGGRFTKLKPSQPSGNTTEFDRSFVARLEESGAVDTGFDLVLDRLPGNQVEGLAVQPSTSLLLVGGAFSSIRDTTGTVSVNRLARITTAGVVDTAFINGMSNATGAVVEAIVSQPDGSILAAGTFSGLGGTGSANVARFSHDSAPDFGFAPSINGPVRTIAQLPTKGAALPTQRSGFAWLQSNGELIPSFTFPAGATLGSVITTAVQQDGKIIMGGTADAANTAGSLVRFNADGSPDTSFQPAVTGTVWNVRFQSDEKILVLGEFGTVGGVVRNNIARLNKDGSLDTGFNPNANGAVFTAWIQGDGKILIGGAYTSLQPNGAAATTARSGIARLNVDGTLDADFNPNPNNTVLAIVVAADGKIWIGGNFTTLQPTGVTTAIARSYIARLNTNGTVDDTVDLRANSTVMTMALQEDKKIVVGGVFTSLGRETRNRLARINEAGTLDTAFNPNLNGTVSSVAVQPDGKILAAGAFSALEPGASLYNPGTATPRNRAVRLNADGTIDPTFNPNFDNSVSHIAALPNGTIIATGSFSSIQPAGSLLIGGNFSRISGLQVSNLALFGSDGSISSTFRPNPDGEVYAIVPQMDGQVIVGGAFTTIAGATRKGVARFKADDTLDTSFNPNPDGSVFAIARQADGKLVVGGSFNSIGGVARSNLARLNTDGSNDSSFNPSISGAVHAIALQPDGRILLTRGTGAANTFVRLSADGSADATFNPANNGAVSSFAVQADGHIVVGGSFTSIGGGARDYVARLTASGALDSTFAPKPNGPVTALSIQLDGKILLGGLFSAIDGLPRAGLGRLSAPNPAIDTFTADGAYTSVTWNRMGGAPEVQSVIFERSTDALNWTTLGEASRIAGTTNWRLSASLSRTATFYIRARALVPATPHGSAGVIRSQSEFNFASSAPAAPVITSATVVSAASGSGFLYAISALGNPTSYGASGLPAGLVFNATTGVISGTPTQQGTFDVILTATNAIGSSSTTLRLVVLEPGAVSDAGRVVNLSVLGPVSAGNPIIAGFVITGSGTQNILIRAVGPGLSGVGVTDPLAAPNLKVFNSSGTVIDEINSWGGGATLAAEFTRLGAFPLATTSADAAVLLILAPGAYTLHINPNGSSVGRALAEVYDAAQTPYLAGSSRLVNISARGVVSAGQTVTGGFVITGNTAKRVLVRGIGPGLVASNVPNPLTDTVVKLHHIGTGVIAENNNWQTPQTTSTSYPAATAAEISAAATQTGAFALATGSLDAAVLVTLAPGIYTAEVGASGSATGAAMVEVYEVP